MIKSVIFVLCQALLASAFISSADEYRQLDPTFRCSAGVKDGRVGDDDMTASSCYSTGFLPQHGRLYNQVSFSSNSTAGCWAPAQAVAGEWLQVDLKQMMEITGVVTQGRARSDAEQWVTSYKISYSQYGHVFSTIKNPDRNEKIFSGNTDRFTPKVNKFPSTITARYVRLVVEGFEKYPSLRMDLLVC